MGFDWFHELMQERKHKDKVKCVEEITLYYLSDRVFISIITYIHRHKGTKLPTHQRHVQYLLVYSNHILKLRDSQFCILIFFLNRTLITITFVF